jgi:hypothetical protein
MIKVPIFFQLNKLGIVGAQKELRKLTNQTKAFGITSKLSIGAASVALTAYSKKSVSAAIADQKAQATLAQTLKNVGKSAATPMLTRYIDTLQRATGVSEELLRPAFEKLIRATGDVTESQRLLALTLDISASTGKTTEQVSASLAKAYLGQTQALGRLGIGLSKADLKTSSFDQIVAKLTKLFEGQAKTAAESYAGQMGILGVASQEASEKIGISLIDALIRLSGNDSVQNLASSMERVAQATANTITGFSIMAEKVKQIGKFAGTALSVAAIVAAFLPQGQLVKPAMALIAIAKSKKLLGAAAIIGTVVAGNKLGAKAEDKKAPNVFDRGLNQRALNFATKIVEKKTEATKLDKAAAATTKLQAMFDLDAIQIAAALKGKISDLDRARLEGMTALKTQATDDDIAAIKKIEYETLRANAAANDSQHLALMNTFDFYESIYGAAKKASDKIQQLSFVPSGTAAPSAGGGGYQGLPAIGNITQPNAFADMGNMGNVGFDLASFGQSQAAFEAGIASYQAAQQSTVVVNVNPSGSGFIGNQDDFLRTVQMALQIGGRNGYSTSGLASG